MISQILFSLTISFFIIYLGKKRLGSLNKINPLPIFLLAYIFCTKLFLKEIILKIFSIINVGFSFDIFLVISLIFIFYFLFYFKINFSIDVSEKTAVIYYAIIFFLIFFFYFEKFLDHNYSQELTSFLNVNVIFLFVLIIFFTLNNPSKEIIFLENLSKLLIVFLFINLVTQTNFLNDLGDFDNGRYMNEVSAIFVGRQLHLNFFNFSGIFPAFLFSLFNPQGIDSLINYRIYLRISLIVFSLLIAYLVQIKDGSKKIDFVFISSIGIIFLHPLLTLRAYSKIFTFLLILIFYLLLCRKFSYITLYLVSLCSFIYFLELPTLSIFVIISVFICLSKDFSLKKGFTFIFFLILNFIPYLGITKVKLSNVLLVPFSLGNNSIPLTFRDMPLLGPFDGHILLFSLLTPFVFKFKDKRLKFIIMSGLSFTIYYSHNSDSGHLMFTTMLLIISLIILYFKETVYKLKNGLFLLLLVLLILSPGFQFIQNPNFNLLSSEEYSVNIDYDLGNVNLSEFSNLDSRVQRMNINKNNIGILAPNAHIAEFIHELETPNIISWPEELAFDKKIYSQFCDYFQFKDYKFIASKEEQFFWYVPGFESRNVLETGYTSFKICDSKYNLIEAFLINEEKNWILLEKD